MRRTSRAVLKNRLVQGLLSDGQSAHNLTSECVREQCLHGNRKGKLGPRYEIGLNWCDRQNQQETCRTISEHAAIQRRAVEYEVIGIRYQTDSEQCEAVLINVILPIEIVGR